MAGLRNSLQIRTTQSQILTMTPQLQQAIRLLQLSTLDLRQEIQATLESNPLLEIDESIANANLESLDALAEKERQENDSDGYDPFNDDASYQGTDIDLAGLNEHNDVLNTADLLSKDSSLHPNDSASNDHQMHEVAAGDGKNGAFGDDGNFGAEGTYGAEGALSEALHDITNEADALSMSDAEYLDMASDIAQVATTESPELKNLDLPDKIVEAAMDPGATSTQENYDILAREDNYSAKSRSKPTFTDEDNVYEGETHLDLHDHLRWQLDCSPLKDADRLMAEIIIEGIDNSGYLTESLDDILPLVQAEYPHATMDDLKVVLKLVQSYDPLGVGARSVQECLMIQLRDKMHHDDSHELKQAYDVVSKYLDLLSNHDYRALCTRLGIKEDTLKRINEIIINLNPRPGHGAVKEKNDFIIPDVLVVKDKNGDYDVVLNPDALPRVRLNDRYKSLVCYAQNQREKEFFKSNLQEANWFIQSIAKRNDTLLKVARCIVHHQRGFLDYGEHRMEPLVLNDIAQEIDMHESTISRVTTEKYLFTARGTFELKYFFSSHVSTENGGTASSTAIRAEIKTLVAKENPRRPYSDNQIASLLREKGFCVARRTIAKYREALGIGSSSQRKRLL